MRIFCVCVWGGGGGGNLNRPFVCAHTHTHTHTRTHAHTHTNLGVAGLPQLPAFLELPILSIQVPQLWMLPPNTKPSGHRTPISMLKPEIDKSEIRPSYQRPAHLQVQTQSLPATTHLSPCHHTPISMPPHTYLHAITHLSPCHHTPISMPSHTNLHATTHQFYITTWEIQGTQVRQ